MTQKKFKIGLSNADKQNMAQAVYERVLALTFNEYDTTTEYEVGDFVVYNDQLYKCISATSGAWDSSKWQLATLNDLVADIENAVAFVNDKANVDGNYPTMTVGAADNLTPYDEDSGVDQEQPFLLQGTGCGNGEQQVDTGALGLLKEKQGHTVVVNQLVKASSYTDANLDLVVETNGVMTGTFITGSDRWLYLSNSANLVVGHKFFVFFDMIENNMTPTYNYLLIGGSSGTTINVNQYKTSIVTLPDKSGNDIGLIAGEGVQANDSIKFRCYVVDLTQWFGSNDNIPAHLLAHPEDFFRYYQGSLAYNEGTLVNANGRYLKAIGRQQWDEVATSTGYIDNDGNVATGYGTRIASSNYIEVIPNADYYFMVGYAISSYGVRIAWYDKDKNLINVGDYYTAINKSPSNACYMRFNVNQTAYASETYKNNITISIYYEGESGYEQYYPYEELANIDTGVEVLRSAGSVADIKLPSGEIKRNVGVVDLSTLSWTYDNAGYYYAVFTGIKTATKNVSSTKYLTSNISVSNPSCPSETIEVGTQMIFVKTSVEPTGTLNYELAEPTTEQGTPFSENVAIDDFGSMDFGGTNGVPQGARIFYAVDYKAFIDSLYNTLDGDATDIVKDSELDSKLANLGYVKLTSVSGYDTTKTQVLKNVEGTLTWVTEE